jgi:UDP-N-acetylmuramoyl-tripeptide--D-alanyl-D-alanine ligase
MLELGERTADAHRDAGRLAAAAATLLIAVGDQGGVVGAAAIAAGLPEEAVRYARDAEGAADLASSCLEPGTVVLVKASRGLGLDRVVEALRR